MTVVEVPLGLILGILEFGHAFFAAFTFTDDVGAPQVGYDITEDVVVYVVGVVGTVGLALGGYNAVFNEYESDGDVGVDSLKELKVNLDLDGISLFCSLEGNGDLGWLAEDGINSVVETVFGVKEVPTGAVYGTVDYCFGVFSGSCDTEEVGPCIAVGGTQVWAGCDGAAKRETGVVNGDGKEFVAV